MDKIAFTGSTEVGRAIRKATAASHKKLSLELGGKSPFIIFEDADLDGAVEGLVDGIWFNQGQVCCAGSRLLVQESVAEKLTEKTPGAHEHLAYRRAAGQSHRQRCYRCTRSVDGIDRLVKQGVAEGAACWQPEVIMPSRGLFTNLHCLATFIRLPSSRSRRDLRSRPGRDDVPHAKEAVELANNTVYGSAASVWSESIQRRATNGSANQGWRSLGRWRNCL